MIQDDQVETPAIKCEVSNEHKGTKNKSEQVKERKNIYIYRIKKIIVPYTKATFKTIASI